VRDCPRVDYGANGKGEKFTGPGYCLIFFYYFNNLAPKYPLFMCNDQLSVEYVVVNSQTSFFY
jgi:hypothetical protein